MTCPQCRKELAKTATRCPHCGTRIQAASGVFQTSTVLISTAGADRVYRSVDEVPARLRHRLLKTTNGANSATILIADRKGRKQIDKAMRKLPGPSQRRLVHSLLGDQPVDPMAWFTPALRKWIAISGILLAIAVTLTVFLYHPKL